MTSVNVLVVFYSRYGETERRALAAGVGAIQARANIRLRRLADLSDAALIEQDASWRKNLDRMSKDYIAPREIDAQWADVLVLAAPRDRLTEIDQYLGSSHGMFEGKLAVVLGPCENVAGQAGLTVIPGEDSNPAAYGRRVTELARERKNA
jgi:NAD(P)H dehydrogenase (quinone)